MSDTTPILYRINPERERPWNELPLLPINEKLFRTVEIFEQLVEAKAALARLHGRSVAIPNQGLLINTISLQEAKVSSEIENIFTTDDELYKAYSNNKIEEAVGPIKEVLHYREALWKGFDLMKNQTSFDVDYFIKMYREVKEASDGVRPPFTSVVIRKGSSGPTAFQTIYTPPRGEGIIEDKLDNLLEFMNDDEKFPIDPILKMAIGHYQFEAIHPFRDGNGRTGRIFNIHYLTHKGLLDFPILFLSRYIIDHKEDYYRTLAGVSQRGDWRSWIVYMLKAVEYTANITFQKINDIIKARENIHSGISKHTDIRKVDQLIEILFVQPFCTVKHFTSAKIYAENTARNYLNKLVTMNILSKKTINGHHYYLNIDLYNILKD